MGNTETTNLKGVSCLCLTYGRPKLLEEAIESFLRQRWDGSKELIVINDHEEQTLVLDHPEVVLINLPRRVRTLGEKRNLSASLAKWDNLLIWDDDDIYLPWRIEETMKLLPKAQFFKCPTAWVMNNGVLEPKPMSNLFHGATAYTRWLFEKSGGYKAMNGGEDSEIEGKFQNVSDKKGEFWHHTNLPNNRLYYIYRWAHGFYHTTGVTDLKDIKPEIEKGVIQLRPQWKQDYVKQCEDAVNELEKTTIVGPISPKTELVGSGYVPPTKPDRTSAPIDFICFSKNRPLQLDAYLRSVRKVFDSNVPISVIYTCDNDYQDAYCELMALYKDVWFIRERNFTEDILSLFSNNPYVCFGCDDVVFTDKININDVVRKMGHEQQFAFSFRLGKNIKRSMFIGEFKYPEWIDDGSILTWDLHKSHAFGDFGYSWELDATVYPSDIARKVVEEVAPKSPNLLEAGGGGKWSNKTKKCLISCFHKSKAVVPTVNVVQNNFGNPVLCKEISTDFLLQAWNCGMRLDIDRYSSGENDCIHVPNFYLTNR